MSVVDVKKMKADSAARLKRAEKLVKDVGKLRTAPIVSPPAAVPPAAPALPLPVKSEPEKAEKEQILAARLSASVAATLALMNLTHPGQELPIVETVLYLKEQGSKAAGGDLSKLQEMLAIQSRTLDLVFNDFLVKASMQTNFDIKEKYIRLAFKSQSQCRATVESLAVIQQGPAIFARQANIANGPQQVNNGGAADATVRATTAKQVSEAGND